MSAAERGAALTEAVEVYGTNFSRWPDQRMVGVAREALLADRDFRARWEAAASLERALAAARDIAAADVVASGGPDRILRALMADTVRPRRWTPRSWVAVAATLVVAAGLGSVLDVTVLNGNDASYEMVLVDPLVFGPAAVEAR